MPLMLPLLNASRKPVYLGKRIAASSLFPFYCLKESDTQFLRFLIFTVNYDMQIHVHVIFIFLVHIFFIYSNKHY